MLNSFLKELGEIYMALGIICYDTRAAFDAQIAQELRNAVRHSYSLEILDERAFRGWSTPSHYDERRESIRSILSICNNQSEWLRQFDLGASINEGPIPVTESGEPSQEHDAESVLTPRQQVVEFVRAFTIEYLDYIQRQEESKTMLGRLKYAMSDFYAHVAASNDPRDSNNTYLGSMSTAAYTIARRCFIPFLRPATTTSPALDPDPHPEVSDDDPERDLCILFGISAYSAAAKAGATFMAFSHCLLSLNAYAAIGYYGNTAVTLCSVAYNNSISFVRSASTYTPQRNVVIAFSCAAAALGTFFILNQSRFLGQEVLSREVQGR